MEVLPAQLATGVHVASLTFDGINVGSIKLARMK